MSDTITSNYEQANDSYRVTMEKLEEASRAWTLFLEEDESLAIGVAGVEWAAAATSRAELEEIFSSYAGHSSLEALLEEIGLPAPAPLHPILEEELQRELSRLDHRISDHEVNWAHIPSDSMLRDCDRLEAERKEIRTKLGITEDGRRTTIIRKVERAASQVIETESDRLRVITSFWDALPASSEA